MTKRRPVPAALHAELSEYSSLLRALRTSDTLDLTSHLLQASSYRSQQAQSFVDDDISLADDEDAATNAPPPTEATSLNTTSEATSSSPRSRLAERSLQSHLAGQRRTKKKERAKDEQETLVEFLHPRVHHLHHLHHHPHPQVVTTTGRATPQTIAIGYTETMPSQGNE